MKKKRILVLLIVFAIFSLLWSSVDADYKFVGSAKSDKYHYPTCEWALKINPENLVTFKSVRDALTAGYVACKVCRPPIKD